MPEQTQGRLAGARPEAVLDIGSNSVRLVVFEQQARSLTTLYNEKSSSELGRGLAKSGKLGEDTMQDALKAIGRFAKLCELTGTCAIHAFATSAVREAANGHEFVAKVEELIGTDVRVLSGSEEGHYAALGLAAGLPDFRGTVGDLGGGSLELADVADRVGDSETFELGAIRLQDDSGMSPKRALKLARDRLRESDLLARGVPGPFAAVGGTWRALAMLQQRRVRHPLHMVQAFEADASDITELCLEIVERSEAGKKVDGIAAVSKSRRDVLPYGAAVLAAALQHGGHKSVVFSAHGVREGIMFDLLPADEQASDPLLSACEELARLRSRSAVFPAELITVGTRLFTTLGIEETPYQRRLREAACLVSDISWRAHPDYRGEQSIGTVAFSDFSGIDHPGRAFLAQTLAYRYEGLGSKSAYQKIFKLAGKELSQRARLLAAWFRLAYPLAAAVPGVLPRLDFRVNGRKLELVLPADLALLDADMAADRMMKLGREAGFRSGVLTSS